TALFFRSQCETAIQAHAAGSNCRNDSLDPYFLGRQHLHLQLRQLQQDLRYDRSSHRAHVLALREQHRDSDRGRAEFGAIEGRRQEAPRPAANRSWRGRAASKSGLNLICDSEPRFLRWRNPYGLRQEKDTGASASVAVVHEFIDLRAPSPSRIWKSIIHSATTNVPRDTTGFDQS